mgnify:FL=1
MELHIVEKKSILIQRCQMYLMDAPIVLGIASRLWLVIKPTVWFYAPSSLSEMALLIFLSLPAQLSLVQPSNVELSEAAQRLIEAMSPSISALSTWYPIMDFFSQEKKRDSFVTFNFLSHLGVVTEVKNHLGIL